MKARYCTNMYFRGAYMSVLNRIVGNFNTSMKFENVLTCHVSPNHHERGVSIDISIIIKVMSLLHQILVKSSLAGVLNFNFYMPFINTIKEISSLSHIHR